MKTSLSKASAKPDHLEKIRYHTAYPIFRFVCSVVKVFSYIAAVIVAVGGVVMTKGSPMVLLPVLGGIAIAVMAKASYEASVMIADLVDSTLDYHARQE